MARGSTAELGVGDQAKRRDSAWDSAVLVERFDESIPYAEPEGDEELRKQLADLLCSAFDSGDLSDVDPDLLLDLAHAAHC